MLELHTSMKKTTYLSLLFLLFCSTACAEGIVLEPQEPLQVERVVLPTPEPTVMPSPQTKLEYTRHYLTRGVEKAQRHRQLVWPILFALLIGWGFFQLLKWIYELTTSSPSF